MTVLEKKKDYYAITQKYANDVIGGVIQQNQSIIHSCERFLRDVDRQGDDDFPYSIDIQAGSRACKFIERLYHTKGPWFSRREKYDLEPWQIFLVFNIFAWLHVDTGFRRFREADIYIPRKNAKSALAHGILLYIFVTEVDAPECYCLANSLDQAKEIWRPCFRQVQINKDLREYYKIKSPKSDKTTTGELEILETGASLKRLIGTPGDGPSPSCVVLDEFHNADDLRGYDWARNGMGAREQPLLLIITTAGDNIASPAYERQKYAEAVADGTITNDNLFAMVWRLDQGADWFDISEIKKCNPNYGVSIFEDGIRADLADAMQSPAKQASFKTKRCNVWVQSKNPFYDMEKVRDMAPDAVPLESLLGRPCLGGVDIASKIDLNAFIALFPPIDIDPVYRIFCHAYLPEDLVNDDSAPNATTYKSWAEQGYIALMPGRTCDHSFIKDDIMFFAENFDLLQVGYDETQAAQMARELGDTGITMVELSQSLATYNEPMKESERLFYSGQVAHGDNPVLLWCLSNIVTTRNHKDEVFPRKNVNSEKIDCAVAFYMALNRALKEDVKQLVAAHRSIYENQDIRCV